MKKSISYLQVVSAALTSDSNAGGWVSKHLQALLFGVSVLLLLGCGIAAFFNTNQLIKHNLQVTHAYEVKKNLTGIYSSTNALSASLSGYILTGNIDFERGLSRYKQDLNQHYAELLRLRQGHAETLLKLNTLKQLLDVRLHFIDERVQRRDEYDEASSVVDTLIGESQSKQILALVSMMEEEEDRHLIQRQQEVNKTNKILYITLITSGILGLLLMLLVLSNLRYQLTERDKNALLLKKYAAIIESSDDAIISKSLEGKILSWNKGAERLFGYQAQEVIGHSMRMLIPDDRKNEEDVILGRISRGERVEHFETQRLHKDGHLIDISSTISPITDAAGKVVAASKIARDISEKKRIEAEIRQLAFYDTLTQLPNRRLLNDRLRLMVAASKRGQFYSALMFMDLDNFKPLNDMHGHVIGDLLLVEVANRLKSCVREIDTVSRFGGDEFVVMLGALGADKAMSESQAVAVAEKIRTTLSEPYQFTIPQDHAPNKIVEHRCTCSIGVVMFNGQGDVTQDELMQRADIAMYQAKDAGRNQIKFYQA